MFCVAITILPFRVFMVFICHFLGWMVSSIGLLGMNHSKPITGWRKLLQRIMIKFGRLALMCCGFHYVTFKGRQVSKEEAPVLVVAPHSSFFDALVIFSCGDPYFISRIENTQYPFLGKCLLLTQAIFVKREDPNSRQNTVKEICDRAKSTEPWGQFVIFPEGTTSNRKALMSFKPGGFIPGCSVQPVLVRYNNKQDTISWTWDQPHGVLGVLFYTLCQFQNHLEIEFLEPYHPSEEEKRDPQLFANNVRVLMASSLGIPLCDLTFQQIKEKYEERSKEE